MTRWIALIRGVVAKTHATMPMPDLRARAEAAGLRNARTLLASGNLIFDAAAPEPDLARALADLVAGFGLTNPVLLRRQSDLTAIRAANPFPKAAETRPGKLLIHLLPEPAPAAVPWDGPERLAPIGREVFIDYVDGVGRSKLTIPRLDRLAGPGGTARNWNTLLKLEHA